MQYGKQFLAALPVSARIYHDRAELFDDLKNWFEGRQRITEGIRVSHEKT
jgi:hypothetical protein